MITQIQIHPNPNLTNKDKGNFFESLIRLVMERQRYDITQQIRFTGTEIDLLCKHKDIEGETALVECKAGLSINSEDVEGFCFDVLVRKKAKYGFFVHTSEIKGEAAGLVEEMKIQYPGQLNFWGPDKVVELLKDCGSIAEPTQLKQEVDLTPTKRLLIYSYLGRYWVTIYTNKIVPTHYFVENAGFQHLAMNAEALEWITGLDELKNLQKIETASSIPVLKPTVSFDSVAEIQEAEQWDDYRPVGSKWFVGRSDVRQKIYQFVQNVIAEATPRRVFFVEGKSGSGKSSILAHLRSRSRNIRNRNSFYVLAVDSRSANTADFVSLAMAKLVSKATEENFIPSKFTKMNITSAYDVLASAEVQDLLSWLREQKRELVIIFDQFEDIFRKEDLFRAFHKLMIDIHNQQGPISVGFSWKSEISIPIDNPAYGLWQQARNLAETFRLDEFLGFEIDEVLRQLQQLSQTQLPGDLKRKLKENSQGFPWLTKKLSIHCYHQMQKGVIPEDLVDKNLNVNELFKEDMETLSPEESRALNLIAQLGYEGTPFDVAEIDDKIQESEINALLGKRLIVRSGAKYNAYWDVFRDFIVEGKAPNIGESFLLRQYPVVCEKTLRYILDNAPCVIEDIMTGVELKNKKEGTVLNRVRELRNVGAVNKVELKYYTRSSIKSIEDFKAYIRGRLKDHVVVRTIEKSSADTISQSDIISALQKNFKGYGFAAKTWETYANYLIAWLSYAGIDLGNRLQKSHTGKGTKEFTPQRRPEKDVSLFMSFKGKGIEISRDKKTDKGLYDLKALGLLTYEGKLIQLSKRGVTLLKADDHIIRRQIAEYATDVPKIADAYSALMTSRKTGSPTFIELMAPTLEGIASVSYRTATKNVLQSWGKFIISEMKNQ